MPVLGFQHPVAKLTQVLRRSPPNVLLVVDQKQGFATLGLPWIRRHRCLGRYGHGIMPRQAKADGGATVRYTFDLHDATRLADEAIDLAQSKTGSLTEGLSRVKWFESTRYHLLRH